MELNYKQISSELLKLLSQKQREVISRRFGLEGGERETLESIGKDFSVTRERVRQIEGDGFLKLEESQNKYQKVSQYFDQYFKKNGGLKREDLALADLGGDNLKNQVFFLLTLDKTLERLSENEDLYPLWTQGKNYLFLIKKNLDLIHDKLKKSGKPLKLKELVPVSQNALVSLLEASKKIQRSPEGLYGLKEWPEINPKRIKDKAYLVFKKEKKPLHFSKVANLIPASLPQTVHNELIKDPRFILVGRGIYALDEWGYEKGVVRDVIGKVLKEAGKPLAREDILKKVLGQRLVKENTVLLNLGNRKYFKKDSGGCYTFRTS